MTGSLRVQNGIYQAVIRYKDKDGNKKSLSRSTGYEIKGNKKKADEKLNELIEEFKYLEYGYIPEKTKAVNEDLFTDVIKKWIKSKENKIERSTYEGYMSYVDCHILPYFEKLNLKFVEVTPKHIKDYYDDRFNNGRIDGKGGLSVRSIRKHSIVLKQVFGEAVITEQIARNPASGVPFPKNEKPQFKGIFLTSDEANKMLQAFSGHEMEAITYVTLYYGLRRSEVLGLKWSAIDFKNDKLRINHTVVKHQSVEYKNKTKTDASQRTLDLLDDVKTILLKLKNQQEENKKLFGKAYKKSDYIFKYADGTLYYPDVVTRSFQRVLKKHGLTPMRFHDLRHSTASIMYDMDCNIKEIQHWLGHADIETTLQIYTHISKFREKATATNLNGMFKLKSGEANQVLEKAGM